MTRENLAWAAVERRDRSSDGAFVYAVRSTRIYCRPSCPSRRPLRKNVVFFETPAAAEEAGYRACRRCQPSSPEGSAIERGVSRARQYLDAHLDRAITLSELAEHVGVSPFHLQRAFKARFGISPRAYVQARRVEAFKTKLKTSSSVTEALYDAGFGSSRGLYERVNGALGMTPSVYRRGGSNMAISYTVVGCSLGRLLVGVTERGVCSVLLGSSDRSLERELARDFPEAERRRDDDALSAEVGAIVSQLDAGGRAARLRLDLRGTDFQRLVWTALQKIPRGETRTYRQIAEAIGKPSAARAVGHACADNRVCLLVPCHRVLRGDGKLGGYRWGLERKQALLCAEKKGRRR